MKMPTLPKMPKLPKLPKLPKPQPKRLQATARRAAQPAMDDYDEEPTTRLSSAFVVVLILHVVAVGGIYAFNSIKAHRRGQDVVSTSSSTPTPAEPVKSAAPPSTNADSAAPVAQVSAPAVAPTPASVAATHPPSTPVSPISGNRIHQVRSGDTLTRVAALYNVSIDDLEQVNGLKTGAVLRLGQTLNIPAGKSESRVAATDARRTVESRKVEATPTKKTETTAKQTASTSSSAAKTYTVKKGENPVTIAKKLGVSYDELLKLNKITDPKKLRVDQVLKIPAKKGE